jgi:hypothetical protein
MKGVSGGDEGKDVETLALREWPSPLMVGLERPLAIGLEQEPLDEAVI